MRFFQQNFATNKNYCLFPEINHSRYWSIFPAKHKVRADSKMEKTALSTMMIREKLDL